MSETDARSANESETEAIADTSATENEWLSLERVTPILLVAVGAGGWLVTVL